MKLVALTLALAAVLRFAAAPAQAELRIGYGIAGKIAKDPTIPGLNVTGQCLPYAQELHRRFQASGIPSRVLVYQWEDRAPGAWTGAHAVVLYNDRGRWYVKDNESWMPRRVGSGKTLAVAKQFTGLGFDVSGAHFR